MPKLTDFHEFKDAFFMFFLILGEKARPHESIAPANEIKGPGA